MDSTVERIQRLEEDLQEIKRTLDRNKSMLRELFEKVFRFIPLVGFSGVACALISITYYVALRTYGSLGDVPPSFHWILGTLIAVSFAVTGVLKILVLVRESRKLESERSSPGLFTLFFKSSMILHVFLPVMTLIVVLSILLISSGHAPYCVAVWAIGCGIMWNAIGAGFSLTEYTVFGYWLLLTGALSLFVSGVHPLLWVAVIFGLGFTFFAAYLLLAGKKAGR